VTIIFERRFRVGLGKSRGTEGKGSKGGTSRDKSWGFHEGGKARMQKWPQTSKIMKKGAVKLPGGLSGRGQRTYEGKISFDGKARERNERKADEKAH